MITTKHCLDPLLQARLIAFIRRSNKLFPVAKNVLAELLSCKLFIGTEIGVVSGIEADQTVVASMIDASKRSVVYAIGECYKLGFLQIENNPNKPSYYTLDLKILYQSLSCENNIKMDKTLLEAVQMLGVQSLIQQKGTTR